jgi:hypothetical protein
MRTPESAGLAAERAGDTEVEVVGEPAGGEAVRYDVEREPRCAQENRGTTGMSETV